MKSGPDLRWPALRRLIGFIGFIGLMGLIGLIGLAAVLGIAGAAAKEPAHFVLTSPDSR